MLALPAGRLVATVVIAAALCVGGWALGASLGPWGAEVLRAGLAGSILSGCAALAGVLVMTPWVARPVSAWMTLWLAGTVLRMLLTPVAAYVLYSATSLAAQPLALSVALTYLATLFSEAAVLSLHVKRATSAR